MPKKIWWICILMALGFGAAASITTPAAAQAGDSSCKTCHEVQGVHPVSTQGDWHIQHAMSDMCAVCHGGDPKAADMAQAHAATIKNPLNEAQARCSVCHFDDFADRAAVYAALITPEAQAAPSTPETVVTEIVPTQAEVSAPETVIPQTTEAAAGVPPAVGVTPAPTEESAAPTAAPAVAAPQAPALSGWMAVMQFTRGPLFRAAFWVFVLGMLYRLFEVLRMGWKHTRLPGKGGAAQGVVLSFLKGLLVLPFVPWVKGVFRRTWITYVAGGLFHLGLFAVVLFSKTHMQAWKSVLGFGWPVLPKLLVSSLAAVALVAMMALLIHRILNPVLRLLSGPAEWLNWALVFLPMLSGFILARKLALSYEMMFSIHMILVDFLLVWIPFSRISHFFFYFFSRAINGSEFARSASPAGR